MVAAAMPAVSGNGGVFIPTAGIRALGASGTRDVQVVRGAARRHDESDCRDEPSP